MKKMLIGASAIIAIGGLLLSYYAISPLFRTIQVNEAAPTGVSTDAKPSTAEESRTASILGTAGHPASGTVRVVRADNQTFIRYENFKTLNGPDLYVYLAKDLDANQYVNLGPLKATEGNVNYLVPSDIDITDYSYVLVWCKQFGVLFNSADISIITENVQ